MNTIDYTKSKDGEPLPETEEEYRPWIKAKIRQAVIDGEFQGINPNADNGLRDDLKAWAYVGDNTPTNDERIGFARELLSLVPEKVKKDQIPYRDIFVREANRVIERIENEGY